MGVQQQPSSPYNVKMTTLQKQGAPVDMPTLCARNVNKRYQWPYFIRSVFRLFSIVIRGVAKGKKKQFFLTDF